MDKELKAKWVAALRSGKYKQGKGVLRGHSNAYCCLGVLCEVAGHDPVEWQTAYGANHVRVDVAGIITETNAHQLAAMNDVHDKSFEQIADYIEWRL